MRILSGLLCIAALIGAPDMRAMAMPFDGGQRVTFDAWLKRNPQYRLATESDCECDEDIATMRKSGPFGTPIPDYAPYFVKGDFRKNSMSAFAVFAARTTGGAPGAGLLLIFDGPFSHRHAQPAFVKEITSLKHLGLFKSSEKGLPLVGPFESEGCVYEPHGRTYVENCVGN